MRHVSLPHPARRKLGDLLRRRGKLGLLFEQLQSLLLR
jgi:hypothetical protein